MNLGYLKLTRRFFKLPIWKEERIYSRAEAWLDMNAHAKVEPQTTLHKGHEIQLQRGMLIGSNRALQQRWKWSNSKVAKFLKYLQKNNMITLTSSPLGYLIQIKNYDLPNTQKTSASIKPATQTTLNYTYTNPEGILRSIATPADFLNLWNAVYAHYTQKPCNRNILSPHNKDRLQVLKKHFGIEDFLIALKGLFENSNFGWTKTDPSHFLEIEHFQNYHTAGNTGQALFNDTKKNLQKI